MRQMLLRLAGAPGDQTGIRAATTVLGNLSPVWAPLAICLTDVRIELLLIALVWGLLCVPGALTLNLLVSPDHPLGHAAARPAIASTLSLLPFGVIAWAGCMTHVTLAVVGVIFGLVFVGWTAWVVRRLWRATANGAAPAPLLTTGETAEAEQAREATPPLVARHRSAAVVVLAGLALLLIGVVLASPQQPLVMLKRQFAVQMDAPGALTAIRGVMERKDVNLSPAATLEEADTPGRWRIVDGDDTYTAAVTMGYFGIFKGEYTSWRLGSIVALLGAFVAAAGVVWGHRQTRGAAGGDVADAPAGDGASSGKSKEKPRQRDEAAAQPNAKLRGLSCGVLWFTAFVVLVYLMRVTYTMLPPDVAAESLPWNVDDVAYVSEAVDYLGGLPMGEFEPSIGSEYPLRRAAMSPLIAPLTATIAAVTGISPPALQHSVLPPLIMLLGASAMAAALLVLTRNNWWMTPLGVVLILITVTKGWDNARCIAEMYAYRVMQTKSLHLAIFLPLQLASLLLLMRSPGKLPTGFAGVVAVVAHLVHPFAAILGAVWSAITLGLAAVVNRRALAPVLIVAAVYGALGLGFHFIAKGGRELPNLSSGRVAGEILQSRDLVRLDRRMGTLPNELSRDATAEQMSEALRAKLAAMEIAVPPGTALHVVPGSVGRAFLADGEAYALRPVGDEWAVYQLAGRPASRLDPDWSFGNNVPFNFAATCLPLLLALGLRRREFLHLAAIGVAVVVVTHLEPLAVLLNKALPTAIMWRARWMLPQYINIAAVGLAMSAALVAVVQSAKSRAYRGAKPGVVLLASFVSIGAFVLMYSRTSSRFLVPGDKPRPLTKFTDDMHELADILRSEKADPFVFGPFMFNHEICQLMPRVRLVLSRDKFLLPAEHEQFRELALGLMGQFARGRVDPRAFVLFHSVYPVEYIVLDATGGRDRQPGQVLSGAGWTRIGTAGRYQVWRAPATDAASTQ